MRSAAVQVEPDYPSQSSYTMSPWIGCDWPLLRSQLLMQWKALLPGELDSAGPNRQRIASLIEHKCGISAELVENYLRNFERTMPLRH
jgi:hypothetical protein